MPYDQDKPASGTSLRVSNPQILENQESLQEAISNEHTFEGTSAGTQTGDHTQGSARCFFASSAPATRVDGDAFIETDNGSLWVNDSDNALSIMTDYNQGVAADKWTLVSNEVIAVLLAANRVFAGTLGVTGDFAVNTDKMTVDAATGNTAVAGTLDVTGLTELIGVATLADNSVTKTTAVADNPAEIANLATVDAQIAASSTDGFDPTSEDSLKDTAGSIVLPSGLKIAWGKETVATNAEETVTPPTFAAIYSVQLTIREDNGVDRFAPKVGNINDTTFTIWNTAGEAVFQWLVIGR